MKRLRPCPLEAGETVADLGELVIAWLNGEIRETPGHCGPPAAETLPLIPALTVLNLRGLHHRQLPAGGQPR